MRRSTCRSGLIAVLLASSGCPSEVDLTARAAAPPPQHADEDSPQPGSVVQGLGESPEPAAPGQAEAAGPKEPAAAGPSLGTGKPDETNGVCRLFAPELPNPECCPFQLGFDADLVQQACGYDLYLGESMHGTCGYYFHRNGQAPAWMRLSFVPDRTVKAAASGHDRKIRDLTRNPNFSSMPIPGVPGAMWSSHEGYSWAFIPGWDRVRQLSWPADGCSPEAVTRIIKALIEARPPAPGTPRQGLVPKARK